MKSPNPILDRRAFLKGVGGAAAVIVTTGTDRLHAAAPTTQLTTRGRQRAIRIAHVTDIHVQPERRAGEGLAACLQHVDALADKPELILFGGDMVFDSFASNIERTKLQWDLWQSIVRQNTSIPWKAILGNHDVFGWDKTHSHASGNEALFGKAYGMDRLAMAKQYYSFDQAGWHFVMLDSIFAHGESYVGKLDDEQFAWLESDLAAVNEDTPVLVLSHIPILSITSLLELVDKVDTSAGVAIPASYTHMDFDRIRLLFAKHRNVRVALSGHTHLIDDLTYQGVRYLCNGAVCGNWWQGNHLDQCPEGYATIDLYNDGSSEVKYHAYGWDAQP